MNIDLSAEQKDFAAVVGAVLHKQDAVRSARSALDGDAALDLWPVAARNGWTGLLDEAGGEAPGAVPGLLNAMLVHIECGRHLAPTGLLGHGWVVATLAAIAHSSRHDLALGKTRAVFVPARPPLFDNGWTVETGDPAEPVSGLPQATGRPPRTTVSGRVGMVPDLPGADVLLVPVQLDDGSVAAALLPAAGPGVEVTSVGRYDMSRPLGSVRLRDAAAELLPVGAAELRRAWFVAQALLSAESLGVSEAVLQLAVDYAKRRVAFGQAIGTYQAIKHQLVEVLRHTENVRSLLYFAAFAAEHQPADFAMAAACARFAGDQAADLATQTCVGVHGGVGVTWEHDAHLYVRRAQLSRVLLGGMVGAGDRIAAELTALGRG